MSETLGVRWLSLFLLVAGLARAQPVAATCYSPDRLGWAGMASELGCQPCCGCRGTYVMQWQYRLEDAGWGAQPISSIGGRYTNSPFPPLTHLERYCMRMRYVDDAGPGQWGPSNATTCADGGSDVCFAWDAALPAAPVVLDGGVIPGSNRVELYFSPSADDGGGVGRYVFRYPPSGASALGSFGSSPTSPVSDILGAGTWRVSLYAEDLARNVSPSSNSRTVTVGFDASIPAASSPSWPATVTRDTYVDLAWVDDGADSWVVTQRDLDGGWMISVRPRVSATDALLSVPGPCRLHAARIGRVLGDQVSDWSPPSADLLVDTVAPVAFAPRLDNLNGGLASLSWPPATDGCPSGLSYRLERAVNGSPFTLRTLTNATQVVDVVDVFGQVSWRIVAVDGAGNQSASDGGASVLVLAVDGGLELDASVEFDAGVEEWNDAGPRDPLSLSVGCGCDGGSQAGTIVMAALLALGISRARSGRARRSHRPR